MLLIDEMTNENFESIIDILESEFDDFWSAKMLEDEIKNKTNKYYSAMENDKIVGFFGISYNLDFIEILNIVTRKDCRKQGIATKMIEKIKHIAFELGTNKICLEVNEKNLSAINLYKKNKFYEVGRRKKYYNGVDDAILMDLEIL